MLTVTRTKRKTKPGGQTFRFSPSIPLPSPVLRLACGRCNGKAPRSVITPHLHSVKSDAGVWGKPQRGLGQCPSGVWGRARSAGARGRSPPLRPPAHVDCVIVRCICMVFGKLSFVGYTYLIPRYDQKNSRSKTSGAGPIGNSQRGPLRASREDAVRWTSMTQR